jgi:hypothetical protein
MPRYNPFRPGGIVTPGMFTGRGAELEALEKGLYQTKAGNPTHLLIQGERGIGKSSLLFVHEYTARGQLSTFEGDTFNFVTVPVELEPGNTYHDLIRKIGGQLRAAISGRESLKERAKAVWEFLQRWEVAGIKYQGPKQRLPDPHELLENLVETVERTLQALGDQVDGALVLIDEADKPEADAKLGEFVKLFSERLTKRGCTNVSLVLAGLPTLLQRLRQSHESSPRIFEILSLGPLNPDERVEVVRKGLADATEKNGYEVTATPEAEDWISRFSEGYPHFIQQFASSAFDADDDSVISEEDVLKGAFGKLGAFEQLGLKYFYELYFEQIGSDEYRAVLRAMAQDEDAWVSKATIRERAAIKETTLNNAITALKKRNIIIPRDGQPGVYKLPTQSFAVWIRAFTGEYERANGT